MKYEHRFRVDAPQAEVAAFHLTPHGLKAITPTPMRIQAAPEELISGSEIRFTLWAGPLPVRWHARVEDVSQQGFTDVQLAGPFKSWQHRHNFVRVGASVTEVYDVVQADLPGLSPAWIVAAGMWISLPLLFAYRAWRTRRALATYPT